MVGTPDCNCKRSLWKWLMQTGLHHDVCVIQSLFYSSKAHGMHHLAVQDACCDFSTQCAGRRSRRPKQS